MLDNVVSGLAAKVLESPQVGQMLVIRLLDGQPNHISIYGAARSFGEYRPDFPSTSNTTSLSTSSISRYPRNVRAAQYLFTFCSGLCKEFY
jgi:hypothetical protein